MDHEIYNARDSILMYLGSNTADYKKNTLFRDVTACSLVELHGRFAGMLYRRFQVRRERRTASDLREVAVDTGAHVVAFPSPSVLLRKGLLTVRGRQGDRL
jgi:hypothetical protein